MVKHKRRGKNKNKNRTNHNKVARTPPAAVRSPSVRADIEHSQFAHADPAAESSSTDKQDIANEFKRRLQAQERENAKLQELLDQRSEREEQLQDSVDEHKEAQRQQEAERAESEIRHNFEIRKLNELISDLDGEEHEAIASLQSTIDGQVELIAGLKGEKLAATKEDEELLTQIMELEAQNSQLRRGMKGLMTHTHVREDDSRDTQLGNEVVDTLTAKLTELMRHSADLEDDLKEGVFPSSNSSPALLSHKLSSFAQCLTLKRIALRRRARAAASLRTRGCGSR